MYRLFVLMVKAYNHNAWIINNTSQYIQNDTDLPIIKQYINFIPSCNELHVIKG